MKRLQLRLGLGLLTLVTAGSLLMGEPSPLSSEKGNGPAWQTYQQGLRHWRSRRYAAAESSFSEAARLAPQWAAPAGHLGVICQLRGQQDEALEYYKQVQAASQEGPEPPLDSPASELRVKIIEAEAAMIWHLNEARHAARVRPLVPEADLGRVARRHSDEMRDRDYFSHYSPVPARREIQHRYRGHFKYQPRLLGENIARRRGSACSLTLNNIRRTHEELMSSPGHRSNIERTAFEWVGVGIAADQQGAYWVTEVFVQLSR